MYLKELSIIDMHFRFLMMKMCSDMEHALKVYLIKNVEDNNKTDGYDIVEAFFHENGYIIPKIEAMSNAPFTADLVHKYFILEKIFDNKNYIKKYDTCPVWVLLELLSFGDFINFYKFYYHKNKQAHYPIGIINLIKSLRNAVAHNNCLLMNLSNKTTNPPALISNVVSKIRTIKSNQRKKRLSSRPILEFVCLLYIYNNIVSDKVKKHRIIELKHLFFVRMIEKKAFFQDNELLKSSYDFSYKIIRHFYGK